MDREAGNMLAGIGGNFREWIFFRRVKEDCYSTIQTMETYFTGISCFENYYLPTFYQLSPLFEISISESKLSLRLSKHESYIFNPRVSLRPYLHDQIQSFVRLYIIRFPLFAKTNIIYFDLDRNLNCFTQQKLCIYLKRVLSLNLFFSNTLKDTSCWTNENFPILIRKNIRREMILLFI